MADLPRTAACYIVLITVCWVIVFYAWLRQRDAMRRNKFRYDLRQIRVETEPLKNGSCRITFYRGQNAVHSEEAAQTEISADSSFLCRVLARWAETDCDRT